MTATRRLTAILAADVAGYSRLMGVDEEGTHERLKALRRELLDPKITELNGRIVKTTGDGLLVEFASVVDAVRCAVEAQQAMPERYGPATRLGSFCYLRGPARTAAAKIPWQAAVKRSISLGAITRPSASMPRMIIVRAPPPIRLRATA